MGESKDYNEDPVYYCSKCLSLRIRGIGDTDDFNYCDECGSTSVEKSNIKEWESLYVHKFGHKYLDNYNTYKYGRE